MEIVTKRHLNEKQIRQLEELYQKEWWTQGRTIDDIRVMLKNTDIIVALIEKESENLVGFCRVLTDRMYKALLLDVIVKETYRSKGLGRRLMDEVTKAPELQKVKQFDLFCRPPLVNFYKKWGFTSELGESIHMRKNAP